jgi:hypothetical protein
MPYDTYTDAHSSERLDIDIRDFAAQVDYQTQHGHDLEAHIARQGLILAQAERARRQSSKELTV